MDDDNQETNEIDDDGSNDVEQLRRAVASESMLCNANTGTIDLLSEFNTSLELRTSSSHSAILPS